MIGSNTLDQLRDMIRCAADYAIPGDVSEDPFKYDGHFLAYFQVVSCQVLESF